MSIVDHLCDDNVADNEYMACAHASRFNTGNLSSDCHMWHDSTMETSHREFRSLFEHSFAISLCRSSFRDTETFKLCRFFAVSVID